MFLKALKNASKEDLYQTNSAGETCLHIAAKFGNLEAFKKIIKKGIDINITDKARHTALDIAIIYDQIDIVAKVLKFSRSILETHHLALAIERRNLDIADLILSHLKIDFSSPDDKHQKPFQEAMYFGYSKIAEYMLKKGALPNYDLDLRYSVVTKGWTPLHYAVENNDLKMVILLVEKGANLGAITVEEKVSKMSSQHLNYVPTFSELYPKDSKANLTPYALAVHLDHKKIISFLEKAYSVQIATQEIRSKFDINNTNEFRQLAK